VHLQEAAVVITAVHPLPEVHPPIPPEVQGQCVAAAAVLWEVPEVHRVEVRQEAVVVAGNNTRAQFETSSIETKT
jgi:hypothetical protein